MPRLTWDQTGTRRYEGGVDRGVLYLPDGSGVPWSGLTSIEEDMSDIGVTSYYYEGIKYLDSRSSGNFSATLNAITYPPEFDKFDGFDDLDGGMFFDNQDVRDRFGLSYRSLIGNDVEGMEYGYKIHVAYNLTATPDNRERTTLSDEQNPSEFTWQLTSIPEVVPGFRPTAHVVFDTTLLNRYLIRDIEDILYGTGVVIDGGTPRSPGFGLLDGGRPNTAGFDVVDGGTTDAVQNDARLPSLLELSNFVKEWNLITVTDNGDGTWTATGPDEFIYMLDSSTFRIDGINATFIDEETYEISTTHS